MSSPKLASRTQSGNSFAEARLPFAGSAFGSMYDSLCGIVREAPLQWKVKAAAFRILEAVPFGGQLHFLAQRHVTRNWPRKDYDIDLLIDLARSFVADYRHWGKVEPSRATFLEIGAGRDLAVPLSLRLLGVGKVVTADIEALAKLDLINHAARRVSQVLGVPIAEFRSWAELRDFGIIYRAPVNLGTADDLPPIDAFISNEVFEHIPARDLPEILSSAHALMRPGGVSIHSIDYSDHFARGSTVSRYNFLQFDDGQWARYNSRYQYVNRLRHGEYIEMFRQTGFEIKDERVVQGDIPDDIVRKLSAIFSKFHMDELRIKSARIVSTRV